METEKLPFDFSKCKRIAVKVGTSTLAYKTGRLNLRRVNRLIQVLSDLKNSGKEIILISSGAVGVGMGIAGLATKPEKIPDKQACAAIGQSRLMSIYGDGFARFNHNVAQILATRDVFSNDRRRENLYNTMHRLLDMQVLPIVNANDSVSIEQLDFDENDTLSAMCANVCGADLLVILTDVDGLYDRDPALPGAEFVPVVKKLTEKVVNSTGGSGSELGSGGMKTKLEAAMIAAEGNIPTVIIKGENPEILYDLFENKAKCTLFLLGETA